MGLWVTVLFGQTEINDIDLVASFPNTHQEVVGLDISVNEALGVDIFDTRDELIGEQEDSFQGELAVAEVEKVLQAGTKKINYHGIVVTLGSEPTDKGNANSARKRLIDAGFVFKLGVLCFDRLQFDRNLFAGDDVGTEVYVTEGTGADFSTNTVLVTDAKVLRMS